MKNYFTISKAAKIVGMTTEALRHYDRINLVKPCNVDEWTGYRYYSQSEIIRLNTIKALQCMDLTLSEIKDILAYDDFGKIIATLKQAEVGADQKIAQLNYAKTKIRRARTFYENKLSGAQPQSNMFVKYYPQRVILLSDTMHAPTLDNLWNYHKHFYDSLPDGLKAEFSFEDLAGIYEQNGKSRLFAVCTRFAKAAAIKILPQGDYLCADCTEENRVRIIERLLQAAKTEYNTAPEFTVQLIVLSGILQWNYQAQVLIS